MTTQARKVLADCNATITEIKDGIQGDEWRRRWITVVVLLRTVGYVLKNVDATQSEKLKKIVDDKWKSIHDTKPEPAIFWEFIEKERNNILKEYKINAGQGITIVIGGPTHYHYTINSGLFKGRDQLDVAQDAIEFWESYLDDIDSKAK